MKKIKYFVLAAFAAASLSSCEDKIDTYSGVDYACFGFATLDGRSDLTKAVDSMSLPLLRNGVPLEDSIYQIVVRVIGLPAKHAREIKAVSIAPTEWRKGPAPAVEGRDFELMPSYVPADSTWGFLKVRIIRSAELNAASTNKEQETPGLRARFRLVDNENFSTGYTLLYDSEAYTNAERAKYKMDGITCKLSWQNATEGSVLWNQTDNVYYTSFIKLFGEFSAAKLALLIEYSGLGREYWAPTKEHVIAVGRTIPQMPENMAWQFYTYYLLGGRDKSRMYQDRGYVVCRGVNKYLDLYKKQHDGKAVLDENGKEIVLGEDGAKYF